MWLYLLPKESIKVWAINKQNSQTCCPGYQPQPTFPSLTLTIPLIYLRFMISPIYYSLFFVVCCLDFLSPVLFFFRSPSYGLGCEPMLLLTLDSSNRSKISDKFTCRHLKKLYCLKISLVPFHLCLSFLCLSLVSL